MKVLKSNFATFAGAFMRSHFLNAVNLIAVAMSLFLSSLASATGTIQGMILDQNGNPLNLPGAAIQIRVTGTSGWADYPVYSNAVFSVPGLAAGNYDVKFPTPPTYMSTSYSACSGCINHEAGSYTAGKIASVQLVNHSYVDIQYKNYPPQVGMQYEVWFPEMDWSQQTWGHPVLGSYSSSDPQVIDKHVQWFNTIGVDFLMIDWSNNWNADSSAGWSRSSVIANTQAVYAEYTKLKNLGMSTPKISLLLGVNFSKTVPSGTDSNSLQEDADFIYSNFVLPNPSMYFNIEGKPLLTVYWGTPSGFSKSASAYSWTDSRFTIRNVTGFPEAQPSVPSSFWSWINRLIFPSYFDGIVEAITVTQAYPGPSTCTKAGVFSGGWGTKGGAGRNSQATFLSQWDAAIAMKPAIILLNQWNEFKTTPACGASASGDQMSVEYSNDIEPTTELGITPLASVQSAVSSWKGITLPTIDGSANTIIGNVDGVTTTAGRTFVIGWACFSQMPSSISVQLFVNGPWYSGTYIGNYVANVTSEAAVGVSCNDPTNSPHRFSISVSAANVGQYPGAPVYVYGLAPTGGTNVLLSNSGVYSIP